MLEIAVILGLAAVGSVAVAIYWTKILEWARNSLYPWVDKHLPSLSDDVRNAFVKLDHVVTPLTAIVKSAWARLRERLVDQVAEFERRADGRWIVRVISWIRTNLEAISPTPELTRVQTED